MVALEEDLLLPEINVLEVVQRGLPACQHQAVRLQLHPQEEIPERDDGVVRPAGVDVLVPDAISSTYNLPAPDYATLLEQQLHPWVQRIEG